MKKNLYLFLAVFCIIFWGTSCVAPRQIVTHSYPDGIRPDFWVEYHPYPDLSGLTSEIRPVPMYEGWTDERMLRDLKRMQFAGFHGILISIRPQDIAREHVRTRCRQFYKLASQVSPDFRLGILFSAGSGEKLSMPLQNVMNFFQHQHFGEFPNAIRLDGKPVLFLDNSMKLTGGYTGRYTYRRIGMDWPDKSLWPEVPAIRNRDGFTWVTAACSGGADFSRPGILQKWSIPRNSGRSLLQGIQQAVNHKAAIICIHSWNNYRDGSFIEENTYDTTAMLWTMKHVQDDLKNAPRQESLNK